MGWGRRVREGEGRGPGRVRVRDSIPDNRPSAMTSSEPSSKSCT